MTEKESVKGNNSTSGNIVHRSAGTTFDFVLQWGNRKGVRCMKVQHKDDSTPRSKTSAALDRRPPKIGKETSSSKKPTNATHPLPKAQRTRNLDNGRGQMRKAASPEIGHHATAPEKGGGSPSGSADAAHPSPATPTWPPKFVLSLTNKEKEEDFFAIKGSKLPQRPRKRAKFIQRSLNLVTPGSWLCDLTLDRYEVREKKISKKKPRGLKAMGNGDSDSE